MGFVASFGSLSAPPPIDRIRVASARRAAHTASDVGELVLRETLAEALEYRLRRLHADVARDHDLFDLLEDRGIDLLLPRKKRGQSCDEAAARRGKPFANPRDVLLGELSLGRPLGGGKDVGRCDRLGSFASGWRRGARRRGELLRLLGRLLCRFRRRELRARPSSPQAPGAFGRARNRGSPQRRFPRRRRPRRPSVAADYKDGRQAASTRV